MQTSEAKRRELERKLGASCLEEICLKKALSDAHAESERLSAAATDINNKYQSAASGESLLKLAMVDHQRRITYFNLNFSKTSPHRAKHIIYIRRHE